MNAILKNWQTSASGFIAGVTLLLAQVGNFLDDDPNTHIEKAQLIAAVSMIWLGLSSRQSNVSDEQSGAGKTPPSNGPRGFGILLFLLMSLVGVSTLQAAPPPDSSKLPTLLAQQSLGSTTVERPATPAKAKAASSEMDKLKAHRPDPGFREALIEAAKQARDDDQISRWELAKIRVATLRNSELLKECQDYILEEAKAEGIAAGEGIDWATLIAFIKEWLPRILELISLFMNDDTASFYRYQLTPFTESTYSLAA